MLYRHQLEFNSDASSTVEGLEDHLVPPVDGFETPTFLRTMKKYPPRKTIEYTVGVGHFSSVLFWEPSTRKHCGAVYDVS